MPKNITNFNKQLEEFLRSPGLGITKLQVKSGKTGKVDPSLGVDSDEEQFVFRYKNGSYDYGTVIITTHDGVVTVWFNDSVVHDPERKIDTHWTEFLKKLKDFALRKGQMTFEPKSLDKYNDVMNKRKLEKQKEDLNEGYYGSKHTSYNDSIPASIRMIIKHNRALDENDQRYRYVDRIFLETEQGERYLLNTKKPSVGRAFARHLAEGGEYNDERWKHISEIAEDINKLGGFVRATKNGQFNESVHQVVSEATSHYFKLKETIKKLQGSRGYNHYFENWQPALMENDDEVDYESMFRSNKLDTRIESALPVLRKLAIKMNEISEANEFESWANSIVEGHAAETHRKVEDLVKLLNDSDEISIGPDAMNIKGQLDDILSDTPEREQLYAKLEKISRADPDHDAKPPIIAWLEEHSDDDEYGEVLDKLSSSTTKAAEPSEPAATPAPAPATPPAPAAGAQPPASGEPPLSPEKQKEVAALMPQPLAEKMKKPTQRNFVAKHAQRSGAGSHGSKGYVRHDKHKKKLGEEGVAEGYSLEEGLGDWIYKKIDDFLDVPKPRRDAAANAVARAPRNLPDDVAERLVAEFLKKSEAQRLIQQAAEAKHTTRESIVHYLKMFAREFTERWESIPQDVKDNALRDLFDKLSRFLLFVLKSILEILVKKEGVAEADYSPIAKETMKTDKIRSLKNLIAIYKEKGHQHKVEELEIELKKLQDLEEARVQQLPTKGADYSEYDTDHLKVLLRPGILHRNEARFKALIRKELQKREQQDSEQQDVKESITDETLSAIKRLSGIK